MGKFLHYFDMPLWLCGLLCLLPLLFLLSGAAAISLQNEYRLRFWEKLHVSGHEAFLKKDYAQAESLYARAVEQARQLSGNDLHLGVSLHQLGHTYAKEKKISQADSCYRQAVDALVKAEQQGSIANRYTAWQTSVESLAQLGNLQCAQQQWNEAEKTLLRAIQIYDDHIQQKAEFAQDRLLSHDVCEAIAALCNLYFKQNRLSDAEFWYHRALAIESKAMLPDQLSRQIKADYARLLRTLDRDDEADFLTASPSWQRLKDSAVLAFAQANFEESKRLYMQAAAEVQQYGAEDPRFVESLTGVALSQLAQGDNTAAQTVLMKVDETFQDRPLNRSAAEAIAELSRLYLQEQQYEKALPLLGKLAQHYTVTGHPRQLAHTQSDYALALFKLGRRQAASEQADKALSTVEQIMQQKSPKARMGLTFAALSRYYFAADDARAEGMAKKAVAVLSKKHAPSDPTIAEMNWILARLYQKQGRSSEAIRAYKEALAMKPVSVQQKRLKQTIEEGYKSLLSHNN